MLNGDTSKVELEFGRVGFWGEGKTGVPGEKPLGVRTRSNNRLNPHMTASVRVEPKPHWWETNALTTAPMHHPYSIPFTRSALASQGTTMNSTTEKFCAVAFI